jgi:hypothetical protein
VIRLLARQNDYINRRRPRSQYPRELLERLNELNARATAQRVSNARLLVRNWCTDQDGKRMSRGGVDAQ